MCQVGRKTPEITIDSFTKEDPKGQEKGQRRRLKARDAGSAAL